MESDKHLFEIFKTNPQWFFELTRRPSPGPCQFVSVTIKAIERRADGILVPDSPTATVTITEFQMQRDPLIYGRVVVEMAMVQAEHPKRKVDGVIVFGTRELDPRITPWIKVVSAYYLDELLEQLAAVTPGHPLVAVFQPLVEKNRELLEQNAVHYYNQIKSSSANRRAKEKLLAVFVDWMLKRFNERGKQEIEKMLLGELPDLQETQAGKDLIAIGIEQGIVKGIAKGIVKGIEQGVEKGELIGKIQLCQSALKTAALSEQELREKSIHELTALASELEAVFRERFQVD